MNPLELEKTLEYEEVFFNRFFGCSYYNQCLNYACEKGWKSFSCRKCEEWFKNINSGEQEAQDISLDSQNKIFSFLKYQQNKKRKEMIYGKNAVNV